MSVEMLKQLWRSSQKPSKQAEDGWPAGGQKDGTTTKSFQKKAEPQHIDTFGCPARGPFYNDHARCMAMQRTLHGLS
eukprot:364833-Chlamydomonas_euryale.AAC.2